MEYASLLEQDAIDKDKLLVLVVTTKYFQLQL